MKPVWFAILVLVLFVVSGMVMAREAACTAVTPINAYANIRREPWVGDNVIGRLNRGETACVVGTQGGWYELERGGYVSASVVVFATPFDVAQDAVTPSGPASPVVAASPTRLVTPTNIIAGQANTPTASPTAQATPVIFDVCIIYGAEQDEVCGLFSSPVSVRVREWQP